MKGLLSSMIIKAVFPQMMALGAYPWDSHQVNSFGEAFFGSIQGSLSQWETVFPYPIRIHVLYICHYLLTFTFNPNVSKHYTWTLWVFYAKFWEKIENRLLMCSLRYKTETTTSPDQMVIYHAKK